VINISSSIGKKRARERDTQEAIVEARGKGHPRHFLTEDIFRNAIEEYVEACQLADNRLPTIFGLARYSHTSAETVRMCEEYYPSSYKMMKSYFQDAIVNCKASKNIMGIFVLKDQHNWQDDTNNGITINYSNVSDKQIETWLSDSGLRLEEPEDEI
jgi:hypothetical protein